MRKWAVRFVIVAVLIVVIIIGIVSIGDAKVYLTGEKVTAHVDSCGSGSRSMGAGSSGIIAAPEARRGGGGGSSRSSSKTCYGTWTYRDGGTGKGKLRGVDSYAGSNVVVRAKGNVAVADSLWKNLFAPVAGLIAFIVLIVLGIRWWRRRDGADGSNSTGGGAPPAGHPQWGQQQPSVGYPSNAAPAPYGAPQPAPYGAPQGNPQQWQQPVGGYPQPVGGYPQPSGGYPAPGMYPQAGGYPPPGQYPPPGSPGAYQPHA
ncbi:hypothetical protein OG563_22500 [Nocardia vinacea]|uniref:Uncharacterized protein n=1 Tax=Nocardia vinacea TaxID=96468 RepID=A0ABZ1Z9J1_9NOCA|nr:hypothetical protein [Nocardia vinacea]